MDESLESLYFNWLYAKIHLTSIPFDSYSDLLRLLHNTEFVWLLTGDDNRAEDGVDLRTNFINESRLDVDRSWFNDGCSILEMMVAFSNKAEFQTDISHNEWFWQFISNLELSEFNNNNFDPEVISGILYNFVWRTYDYNGYGGMFPMRNPPEDQRKVEIWYQFNEYIVERNLG